jgi:hypothetical protein
MKKVAYWVILPCSLVEVEVRTGSIMKLRSTSTRLQGSVSQKATFFILEELVMDPT